MDFYGYFAGQQLEESDAPSDPCAHENLFHEFRIVDLSSSKMREAELRAAISRAVSHDICTVIAPRVDEDCISFFWSALGTPITTGCELFAVDDEIEPCREGWIKVLRSLQESSFLIASDSFVTFLKDCIFLSGRDSSHYCTVQVLSRLMHYIPIVVLVGSCPNVREGAALHLRFRIAVYLPRSADSTVILRGASRLLSSVMSDQLVPLPFLRAARFAIQGESEKNLVDSMLLSLFPDTFTSTFVRITPERRSFLMSLKNTFEELELTEDSKLFMRLKLRTMRLYSMGRPLYVMQNPDFVLAMNRFYSSQTMLVMNKRLNEERLHVAPKSTNVSLQDLKNWLRKEHSFDPALSTIHCYHLPRNASTHAGRQHHDVHVPVRRGRMSKTQCKPHFDDHYSSAYVSFFKFMYLLVHDAVVLSIDDRARVPCDTSPTLRPSDVPLLVDEEFGSIMIREVPVADYEGTKMKCLVPTGFLRLQTDTPSNQKKLLSGSNDFSLNGGQAYYYLKANVSHPSSAPQHLDEIMLLVEQQLLLDVRRNKHMLMIVDGGPDQNPRFRANQLLCAFMFYFLDLDSVAVCCHQGGGSKKNPVERVHSVVANKISGEPIAWGQGYQNALEELAVRMHGATFSGNEILTDVWNVESGQYLFFDANFFKFAKGTASEAKELRHVLITVTARLSKLMEKMGVLHKKSITHQQLEDLLDSHGSVGFYHTALHKCCNEEQHIACDVCTEWPCLNPLSVWPLPTPIPDVDRVSHYMDPGTLFDFVTTGFRDDDYTQRLASFLGVTGITELIGVDAHRPTKLIAEWQKSGRGFPDRWSERCVLTQAEYQEVVDYKNSRS